MHLYAPARSRNPAGQPEYHSPAGKAIATLQRLELWPEPDGSWTIGSWWCYRHGTARGYWLSGKPLAECVAWAERFVADPETTMAELGWQWDEAAGRSRQGGGGGLFDTVSTAVSPAPAAQSLDDLLGDL